VSDAYDRPAARESHPDYDNVVDAIGENPARWLDRELVTSETNREWVKSLVDGIRDPERLAAWRAVEKNLGRGRDGGPRQRVLDWLDDRAAEIAGDGPPPRRHGPRRPPASLATADDHDPFEWADRDDDRRGATVTAGGGRR
jgi:hypothetical protein